MTENQGPLENLPLPPGQLAGAIAGILASRWLEVPLPGPRRLQRVTGFGLMAVGSAVNIWALAERRRSEAGAFELERPTTLVTTGPYAVSRNPMYVGWWLIHLGSGVARGSAWVLLTVPAAVLAEHPGVTSEERTLEGLFPAEWADYSRRVARYFGRQPWGCC
ncbi:isoprenylcysteine carboxylmethyltransferase family protein [Arthrobacter sp. 4R501]|uniref:methyltransferase family protein n=1 Tax=Arthrobacter sp. 4R501 TaxID=2058886 RepID=UPI000CE4C750|nr:isoprenylcysteine carboxylmethyltransferase family protein [Arthrobacter sp. 4R501]